MAGTFDIALNRLNHDMVFRIVEKEPEVSDREAQPFQLPRHTIWPIDGADKVAQQIKMTLLAFLTEWFLDVNFGVPYLEDIMIKNPRMTSVENIFRAKIMDVPNVLRITYFNMEWDRMRRTLAVEFHCNTLLGPVKDSVILNTIMRTR